MRAYDARAIASVIVDEDKTALLEFLNGSSAFVVRTTKRMALVNMRPGFHDLGYSVGPIRKEEQLQHKFAMAVFIAAVPTKPRRG